jgi:hypothetical protein
MQSCRRKIIRKCTCPTGEGKLEDFLRFNNREILRNFEKIKRETAEKLALDEYEKYDAHRRELEVDDVDELEADIKHLKA